jgi:hypothetical protein
VTHGQEQMISMNPEQTTHPLRGTRRHAPGRKIVATRADQRSLTQQIEQKNAPGPSWRGNDCAPCWTKISSRPCWG